MSERITDKAWRAIVAASISGGTHGKVFRMSAHTLNTVARERDTIAPPVSLYGVFIVLDSFMRDGEISLEER